eukprot:3497398-Rhodomonas_salina.2
MCLVSDTAQPQTAEPCGEKSKHMYMLALSADDVWRLTSRSSCAPQVLPLLRAERRDEPAVGRAAAGPRPRPQRAGHDGPGQANACPPLYWLSRSLSRYQMQAQVNTAVGLGECDASESSQCYGSRGTKCKRKLKTDAGLRVAGARENQQRAVLLRAAVPGRRAH